MEDGAACKNGKIMCCMVENVRGRIPVMLLTEWPQKEKRFMSHHASFAASSPVPIIASCVAGHLHPMLTGCLLQLTGRREASRQPAQRNLSAVKAIRGRIPS